LAYIGGPFKHDLFISYSHGVDVGGRLPLRDWSRAFADALRGELLQLAVPGDSLSLFIDEHDAPGHGLDPMAPLTEQLKAEVSASALLVVLLSPPYQKSTWCRDERAWWWQCQVALGRSPADRIVLGRIWPEGPWPEDRWPPELVDSAGHPLIGYTLHSGSGPAARPKGWTQVASGLGTELLNDVVSLSGDLSLKLGAIRADTDRRRAAQDEAQRLAGAGGQLLYLHGRADRADDWERAFNALEQGGYAVLPTEPEPIERDAKRAAALREERVNTLSGCDALLLLGSGDGPAVDADLSVVGRFYRESARQRASRESLPCALLDTVGPPLDTPRRRSTARNLGTDWLDATQGPVVPVVRQWLAGAATPS